MVFDFQDGNNPETKCISGNKSSFAGQISAFRSFYDSQNYSARVRAITPAGNGSWSNRVFLPLEVKVGTTGET